MHTSRTGRGSSIAAAALIAAVIALAASEARAAVSFVDSSQSPAGHIKLVGSGSQSSSGSSLTIPLPAGSAEGDVMVGQLGIRGNPNLPLPDLTASGWSMVNSDVNIGAGGARLRHAVYFKVVTSDDVSAGSVNWDFGVNRTSVGGISVFRGVDTLTPINNSSTNSGTADINTITATGFNTTVGNAMLIALYAVRGNETFTPPSGFEQRYHQTNGNSVGIMAANFAQAAAGATGDQIAILSDSNDRRAGHLVALTPNVNSLAIEVPAGTVAGDVMIASVSVRPSAISITLPSGWTLIREVTQTSGTSSRLAAYYRVAGSAEPASYSWMFAGGTHTGAVGGIASFRGVDTGGPIDVEDGVATPDSLDHTAPDVTTTENDGMLITVHAFGSSATWTAPTGMTEAVDIASLTPPNADGISLALNYEARPVAGATGTRTASASNDSDTGATHSIALRPGVFTPPLAGLLAHYALDEAFWTGTANEVVDSGANALHGVSRNGANTAGTSPAIPVSPGTCRYGAFAGGSFVEGRNASAINSASSVSVAAWVRMNPGDQAGTEQTLIAYGGATNTIEGRFHLFRRTSDERLYFEIRRQASDPINPSVSIPGGTVFDGSWHHIVGSFERNNRELKLYIDGVLAATTSFGGNRDLNVVSGPLAIAALPDGSNDIAGDLDEVNVFDSALTSAEVSEVFGRTRTCAVFLDHIRIEHDGEGLTCTPEEVTLRACANPACTESYNLSVTTTLQPIGWVGGDTISFSGGSTPAQLRRTTAGTVTLGAAGTSPTPISAARCFNGGTVTCGLTFVDSGFIFDVPTVTACKSANVTISAVKKNPADASCAPAFSGIRPVNFWSTYLDPDTGTKRVTVNSTVVETASPGTTVDLNFDANAQATVTVNYPDAGLVRLNARHEGTGDEADLVMTGNDDFVSVPVGLAVFAAASCPAGDATCDPFGKAGEPFDLNVKAACWVSDVDTDLSDNPATPNFRMTGVPIEHTLVAPIAGQPGTLGITSLDFTDADNGVRTISQTISEVGVFTFTATPADGTYFGETVPAGTSPNIGRFTPDHFALTNGALVNRIDAACSPVSTSTFTYMGEILRLGFSLTAQNASNATTENYTGAFARLDLNVIAALNIGAIDTAAPTPLTSRVDAVSSTGTWSSGAADDIFARVGLNRAVTVDGQFQAVRFGVAPVDLDGVALVGFDLDVDNDSTNDRGLVATGDIRYGRLLLQNAFGSELVDLSMPMRAQYYVDDDTGFVTNNNDNCTAATLTLSNHQGNLAAGDTCVLDNGSPGLSGQGCGVAAPVSKQYRAPAAGGDFNLHLQAPGPDHDGSVDVAVDLSPAGLDMPWLQFDWDGDGVHDNDPQGRATFGIYKGNPRHIYRRELY